MNIGIVTTWFERGAAYVSKQYKDILERQGNKVFIYARGGEEYAIGNPRWDFEDVYWSKKSIYRHSGQASDAELVRWARKNDIDVVIFNEQKWLKNVISLKRLGFKVGAYIDYYTELMLPTFAVYDFLLCNTQKHYSAFRDLHPHACYIPWGTDVELYNTAENREDSEILRFFHSSGMSAYRKGTDLAVEAYLRLSEEFKSKSELIIHSQKDPFSSLAKSQRAQVDKLIRSNNIKVIEKTVSAPGLYHLGDVYVYPSRLDGLGLTVAEALATGMPVIVPNDGPMNEFLCPNSRQVDIAKYFCRADAYFWPMNEVSVGALKNAYEYFISNKSRMSRFSQEAREAALSKFDFHINMSKLTEIIARAPKHDVISDQLLYSIKKYTNSRFPFMFEFWPIYGFLRGLKSMLTS